MKKVNRSERKRLQLITIVMASIPNLTTIAGRLESLQMVLSATTEGADPEFVRERVAQLKGMPEWSERLGSAIDPGFQIRFPISAFEVPCIILDRVAHGDTILSCYAMPERLFGARTRFMYGWTRDGGWEILIHAGLPYDWNKLYQLDTQKAGIWSRLKQRFSKEFPDNYGL